MKEYIKLIPLFVTLIAVVFDGYSMMSYRTSVKRSHTYFAFVTFFCLVLNSYMAMKYGLIAVHNMIITFSVPYLILILALSKDKISQTLFNFWLWTNVFRLISNLSALKKDSDANILQQNHTVADLA